MTAIRRRPAGTPQRSATPRGQSPAVPSESARLPEQDDSRVGRFSWNSVDRSMVLSVRAKELVGVTDQDNPVPPTALGAHVRPGDAQRARALIATLKPGDTTEYSVHLDVEGESRLLRVFALVSAGDLGGITLTGTLENITSRTQRGAVEVNLARALTALDNATRIVGRATDEDDLVEAMCNVIVQDGGYLFAWYGAAEYDAARSVTPRAWSGTDGSFVIGQRFGWGADRWGNGPSGQAIKTGEPQFAHLIDQAPGSEPWREAAAACGYNSSLALPVEVDGAVVGALAVYAAEPTAFDPTEVLVLGNLARQLGNGITQIRDHDRSAQALEGVLGVLEESLGAHEVYTAGHEQRVSELAVAIARQLGLPAHDIEGIRLGAILHDVGKVGIPADLLCAPRRLTADEFRTVQQHPIIGSEIIARFDFPYPVAEMVRHHHERLDGSGYPDGQVGDDLTMAVRIIAVADVVDSMARARPYRAALGVEVALAEITANAGILFDPDVVDACVELVANGVLAA